MTFWVDIKMRTNRAPFFCEPVTTNDFDDVQEADAWARKYIGSSALLFAFVSDDTGAGYPINERHPSDPPLAYHSFGVNPRTGEPSSSTD